MKGLSTIACLLFVLLLGITISALSSVEGAVDRPALQSGVQRTAMLESDMAMLEQMRA